MDLIRKVENGATAVEYALFMAFVAIPLVAVVTLFGESVNDLFHVPWP